MEQQYIVLGILGFFVLGLVLNKWSFGLTALTCCALLFLTGVCTLKEAFSGLTEPTMLLVAGMYVMSAAFSKTQLMVDIQNVLFKLQGKSGLLMTIGVFLVVILFCTFIPPGVTGAIMVAFLSSLGNEKPVSMSRLIIPACSLACLWCGTLPMGFGSAAFAGINAFYEGMATDPSQLVTFFQPFIYRLIPCVLCTLWAIFGNKVMPQKGPYCELVEETVEHKEHTKLPKRNQTIIYIVFGVVMLAMVFSGKLGNLAYCLPVVGSLILLFTKALPRDEINKAATSDMAWFMVGILSLSNAMSSSGAGNTLGNAVLSLLGKGASPYVTLAFFGFVCVFLTNLMSNMATRAIFTPIAAATAIAAGWNPIPFVLICSHMPMCAAVLPASHEGVAMGHIAAGQRLVDTLKWTLPYCAISLAGCMLSTILFFPL